MHEDRSLVVGHAGFTPNTEWLPTAEERMRDAGYAWIPGPLPAAKPDDRDLERTFELLAARLRGATMDTPGAKETETPWGREKTFFQTEAYALRELWINPSFQSGLCWWDKKDQTLLVRAGKLLVELPLIPGTEAQWNDRETDSTQWLCWDYCILDYTQWYGDHRDWDEAKQLVLRQLRPIELVAGQTIRIPATVPYRFQSGDDFICVVEEVSNGALDDPNFLTEPGPIPPLLGALSDACISE